MNKKWYLLLFFILLSTFKFPLSVHAQAGSFNHPEVKWQIIETEHFKVFADRDLLDVAGDVAQIAEEIFPRVTDDLGYVPGFKVPLVLIDYDQEFNGSAEPLFGRMVIYCSSGTKVTSGNLPWFRRVIAHEFSHVITFGALGAFEGFNQRYQVLGALQILPMWFLEGIAQWEGETWDTHRDMFLRTTVLEGKLLPPSRLEGFAGTDIRESRLIYEQGHSLIRFIAATYGRDKIKKILSVLRKGPFSIGSAIKAVLKEDFSTVYRKWLEHLYKVYENEKKAHKPYYEFSRRLTHIGGWVYHPVFSPDGKSVLYASSFEYDYATCDLYIARLEGNRLINPWKIAERVGFFHSFSPDGKKILFTKIDYCKNGSIGEDIYVMDLDSKNIKRLTYNERAKHPSFSPDGKKIAYVVNKKGVTDIYLMDADGKNKVNLTAGVNYEQNDSPQWSRDGRFLAFSHFAGTKRDIALIDFKEQKIIKLTDDEWDDRTPVFLRDGSGLLFTSDRGTGIPNLFLMKLERGEDGEPMAGEIVRLTDVLGGIFEPDIDSSGKRIIFSGFGARGFDLYLCELDRLGHYEIAEVDYSILNRKRNRMYVSPGTKPVPTRDLTPESIPLQTASEETPVQYPPSEASAYVSESESIPGETVPEESEIEQEEIEFPPVAYYRVSGPKPYNSFASIQPIFILPAITMSVDDRGKWGLLGSLDWYFLDPLEKHIIMGYSYFDASEAIYSWYYINRQFYPTITLNGYQKPFYPGGGGFWSRYKGNTVEAEFPIDGRRSISLLGLFQGIEEVKTDSEGYVISSNTKWDNGLGIALRYFTAKERVDTNFNPAGGRFVDLLYFWSDPVLGSNYQYNLCRLDWREYVDVWRRGGHTLALRFYARAVESMKDYQISMPWDDNTLRGIQPGSVKGNRNFAASLEYRFPVVRDMELNILGMYFDRWYVVPFVDYGIAWYGNNVVNNTSRYSFGLEYRFQFWIMSRYAMLFRLGILTTGIKDNRLTGGWLVSIQPVY